MLPNSETANSKVTLDPELKDLQTKDVGNQTLTNPVGEDSKQTKEEFGKQVSTQLGPEEVKQVQSEGELSISSQKKSVTPGKPIFKD